MLVRPDGHVAWRAATADRPEAQLRAALDLALGRAPAAVRAAGGGGGGGGGWWGR